MAAGGKGRDSSGSKSKLPAMAARQKKRQKQKMCAMCGSPIAAGATATLVEIDGTQYAVDREECAMTLRKFRCVYGSEFCAMLA
jgi:hypothetical protein